MAEKIKQRMVFLYVIQLVTLSWSSQKFNPCKPLNPVTKTGKAQMVRLFGKVISHCAYKVFSNTGNVEQVKSADAYAVMPHFYFHMCLVCLITYNRFGIGPNRLSEEMARNATAVIIATEQIFNITFSEEDGRSMYCYKPNKTVEACVKRRVARWVTVTWWACFRHIARKQLPETVEDITFGIYYARQKLRGPEFMRFFGTVWSH